MFPATFDEPFALLRTPNIKVLIYRGGFVVYLTLFCALVLERNPINAPWTGLEYINLFFTVGYMISELQSSYDVGKQGKTLCIMIFTSAHIS